MMRRSRRLGRPSRRAISCSAVTIGASGLRSSWPSMARNSSLARLAVSASRSAACAFAVTGARCRAPARRAAPARPISAQSSSLKWRPDSACSAPSRRACGRARPAARRSRRACRCACDEGAEGRGRRTSSTSLGVEVGEEGLAGGDRPGERAGRVGRRHVLRLHEARASRRARAGSTWWVSLRCSTPSVSSRSMRHMSAMLGTITEAIAASVVCSSSERDSSAPALTSSCKPRLGAARRSPRACALGIEQQLALGLASRALRGGGDERLGDRLDLDQAGLGVLDRRAAAERRGGVAAGGAIGRRCCPRAARRRCCRAAARAGCRRRRPAPESRSGAALDRRGHAERDHPARRANPRERGVHVRRLRASTYAPTASLRAPSDVISACSDRRRRRAEVALVLARAGDARAVRIEHRDDPVVGNALLADDAQDRLRAARSPTARSAARRRARPGRARRLPKLPSGPRVSEPITGARVRATSSRLPRSLTCGGGAPIGVAVLKSGSPAGVASRTARHSGRVARTRCADSCACGEVDVRRRGRAAR